jgi:hypothetical protein
MKQKQVYPQQYQQQDYISRNPNYQQHQQYYQNIPSQKYNIAQPQIKPQKQVQDPKQLVKQDKPLIESQFMPEFQLANSVIDQSEIPMDQNQMNYQMQKAKQNQNQNKNYMIPRRNPNKGVRKYEITGNNHYVNTNDPNYSMNVPKNINNTGMNSNVNNNNNNINQMNQMNQNQSQNQGMNDNRNIYGEQNMENKNSKNITEQSLNRNITQLMNKDGQIEVGEGISCLGNSSIMGNNLNNNINMNNQSNINNTSKISNNIKISNNSNMNNNNSNLNNINDIKNSDIINSNLNMSENNNQNQINPEEIEKEKPIEEKIPDVSNIENPNNFTEENYEKYQPHYSAQEVHESKLKESIDIDSTLDRLPTIDEIMKGIKEMLPPPKKEKPIEEKNPRC